jgi:hypothetical protein
MVRVQDKVPSACIQKKIEYKFDMYEIHLISSKYTFSHALTCLISFFVPSILATGTVAHASLNYVRDSLGFVQCGHPLPAYRNCNYSRTSRPTFKALSKLPVQ